MSAPSDPIPLFQRFGDRVVEALVSPVGASLQQLRVDGLDLVAGSPDGPVGSSGAVLVPWPNRVRGGRWMLDGDLQQLDVTEPEAGNALHGLVARTSFAVLGREAGAVQLTTTVRGAPGYPFDLAVTVSYRLTRTGVASTIAVLNRSDRPAPVGIGVHPYLRVGEAKTVDLLLQVDAERTLRLGDDNLPLEQQAVSGTSYDLRTPTPLTEAPAHAAYTALRATDGRVTQRLTDRSTGRTAEVWADARFRWAQVYVTDRLPRTPRAHVAVALEPMTAPPDALNSGVDLEWLAPASRWVLAWGINLR
ncbi:hypothetical protein AB4Z18_14325 [Leifsonia sp. 2TAF2]|uniref:aldose epimerase family protein n=1 Tax=Leifsonia sp. 2TAF2 TaxID=3233009 RepID=UPI003F986089